MTLIKLLTPMNFGTHYMIISTKNTIIKSEDIWIGDNIIESDLLHRPVSHYEIINNVLFIYVKVPKYYELLNYDF